MDEAKRHKAEEIVRELLEIHRRQEAIDNEWLAWRIVQRLVTELEEEGEGEPEKG